MRHVSRHPVLDPALLEHLVDLFILKEGHVVVVVKVVAVRDEAADGVVSGLWNAAGISLLFGTAVHGGRDDVPAAVNVGQEPTEYRRRSRQCKKDWTQRSELK